MKDADIQQTISALVDEEHELRAQLGRGEISTEQEHRRLDQLETELDQLWDLLRQRKARRAAGQDPDDARGRSASVVENYEN